MVRHLTLDDIPAAFELSYDAGWNQTPDDWRRLLTLEPDGCFGINLDARLIATAVILCHDASLAWLGMVLTHPDYRRRGFARQFVEAAIALADSRHIRTIKLDASDQGRPLYLELGFEDEQPIERWYRSPGSFEGTADAGVVGLAPRRRSRHDQTDKADGTDGVRQTDAPFRVHADSTQALNGALDLAAFGADRSRYLAALGHAQPFHTGYLLQRGGSRARYMGPCVADDPVEAATAIGIEIAARPAEPWMWDILPHHPHAPEIARGLGFKCVRTLTRMRRGVPLSNNNKLVYAIAGFEAG